MLRQQVFIVTNDDEFLIGTVDEIISAKPNEEDEGMFPVAEVMTVFSDLVADLAFGDIEDDKTTFTIELRDEDSCINLDAITRGTVCRPPRIVLLGVEKVGKSTFAAGAENPIFLPIKGEEGIDGIDVSRVPVCNEFRDATGWLDLLRSVEHEHNTVVIDSASTLESLIWSATCQANGAVDSIEKVGGGYGKGYTEALKYWQSLTEWLDALRTEKNMASIIIGHVKTKRFDDPIAGSYDRYQFDIHDKAASLLYRWADVILFCNTKTIVRSEDVGFNKEVKTALNVSEGQRFLYTQMRPSHPGGGRGAYGQLPYEIPLYWSNFRDAVAGAMQQPVV